jgi:hypothetical protein
MLYASSFEVGAHLVNAGFAISAAAQRLLLSLRKSGPRKQLQVEEDQAAADELENLGYATWTNHGFSITPCGQQAPKMFKLGG